MVFHNFTPLLLFTFIQFPFLPVLLSPIICHPSFQMMSLQERLSHLPRSGLCAPTKYCSYHYQSIYQTHMKFSVSPNRSSESRHHSSCIFFFHGYQSIWPNSCLMNFVEEWKYYWIKITYTDTTLYKSPVLFLLCYSNPSPHSIHLFIILIHRVHQMWERDSFESSISEENHQ